MPSILLLFWELYFLNLHQSTKMAWTTVNIRVLSDSDFSNMNVIRELLYIKHNFADMTLYSKDGIDFILEYCCTS